MTDSASSDRLRLAGRNAIVLETFEDLVRFNRAIAKLDGEDLKAALREVLHNDDPYYFQTVIGPFDSNPIAYMTSRSPASQGMLLFEILKARFREATAPSAPPCDCLHEVTPSFLGARSDCGKCGGTGRLLPPPPTVEPSAGRGRVVFETLMLSVSSGTGFKGDRQGLHDLIAYMKHEVRCAMEAAARCSELMVRVKAAEAEAEKVAALEARVKELEHEIEGRNNANWERSEYE